MTADRLREAAALMRSRAEAARAGRWLADGSAEHIASWHPAVALAVADWLDAEADDHDRRVETVNLIAQTQGWDHRISEVVIGDAPLAVARTYLGDDQ